MTLDESTIDAIASAVTRTMAEHGQKDYALAGEIVRAVLEALKLRQHSVYSPSLNRP